jgi:hypothetical protein
MIKFSDISVGNSFMHNHNGDECAFIKCQEEKIDDAHIVNCVCLTGIDKGKLLFVNEDSDCTVNISKNNENFA